MRTRQPHAHSVMRGLRPRINRGPSTRRICQHKYLHPRRRFLDALPTSGDTCPGFLVWDTASAVQRALPCDGRTDPTTSFRRPCDCCTSPPVPPCGVILGISTDAAQSHALRQASAHFRSAYIKCSTSAPGCASSLRCNYTLVNMKTVLLSLAAALFSAAPALSTAVWGQCGVSSEFATRSRGCTDHLLVL